MAGRATINFFLKGYNWRCPSDGDSIQRCRENV